MHDSVVTKSMARDLWGCPMLDLAPQRHCMAELRSECRSPGYCPALRLVPFLCKSGGHPLEHEWSECGLFCAH